MSQLSPRSTYPLKLPMSVKKAAQRLAKEDGVSLNQWIAVAVAQKIGVVDTAAEFFKRRGAGGSAEHFKKMLGMVSKNPDPLPGDEPNEDVAELVKSRKSALPPKKPR